MSTARVTRILELVAELDDEERSELAARLESGPEGFESRQGEGLLGGLALTIIDEAVRLVAGGA
jgi:hypothetical protein